MISPYRQGIVKGGTARAGANLLAVFNGIRWEPAP
jgi:hypothetical protein